MKVLYLKSVTHPLHLTGEPGDRRDDIDDGDAHCLASEGYVSLLGVPMEIVADGIVDSGPNQSGE